MLKVGKPQPEKKIDLSSIIKEGKEDKEDLKEKIEINTDS
jgi:hypothetical protein